MLAFAVSNGTLYAHRRGPAHHLRTALMNRLLAVAATVTLAAFAVGVRAITGGTT